MGMTDEECMQYVIGGEWNLDTKDGLKFVYEVASAGMLDVRNVKCNYDMVEEAAKANISSAFPGRHAVMERLELLVSKIDENSDGLLSKQELVNILVHADLTGEKLSRRKAQKEAEDMVGEAGLSGRTAV